MVLSLCFVRMCSLACLPHQDKSMLLSSMREQVFRAIAEAEVVVGGERQWAGRKGQRERSALGSVDVLGSVGMSAAP